MVALMLARPLSAQERGAVALGELVAGLGVNTRVLVIGAHPDDEDTNLITWLQRGRHVETAYLSLTRGDGGQNLIGNELGEALGVIRTEELLAARRIDGARQYFTRAFDFGFSKDTIDTFKHWSRDAILRDVVRVVREFRPHVIVAVFSGTPADGHGHHQVSGLLARAAYDLAGDTVRFPSAGPETPWTPLKFYRLARGTVAAATLSIDVGEYSPLLGRSFGEIAGESRSQHKSQGFGALQRKGPIIDRLSREASRVNEATAATAETSLFDGIDTTWARFRPLMIDDRRRRALDSVPVALNAVRSVFAPFSSTDVLQPLRGLSLLFTQICPDLESICPSATNPGLAADLGASTRNALSRIGRAQMLASGVELEALVSREVGQSGKVMPVVVTVYNHGSDSIHIRSRGVSGGMPRNDGRKVAPFGTLRDTLVFNTLTESQPWWLEPGPSPTARQGSMFVKPGLGAPENDLNGRKVFYYVERAGKQLVLAAPITFRFADQVEGEQSWPVVGAPTLSVTLDAATQYARANAAIDRIVSVRVRSAADSVRNARVTLSVPTGLVVDSATRTISSLRYDEQMTLLFRVRGRLAPGTYRLDAMAELNGEAFTNGYELINYAHIRRQRIYRPASVVLSAVDVVVPAALKVAYIAGVGDNVAPAMSQLGIPTTVVAASDIARTDLTQYSTVVVGPRAYEAHPELLAANPKLFDFARKGGVLLVQYGQYEMTQPGAMPFPITLSRPADRVTLEDAPVTFDAPNARELAFPNKITASDFDGWVQERGLYMPRTFDPAYRSFFSMNDPNEAPLKSGLLVAPLGDGLYVYAPLSFFRQLPAGVPGGARLFVNLLSAKLAPPGATP